MINLGDRVKSKITGFTGIAVSRAEFLNGCIRFQVQPETLKDGKQLESEWVDDVELQVETTGVHQLPERKRPGGPHPNPERSRPLPARS